MTEKIKRGFSYLKGKISSGLKHLKGVSKGGEEFTHKLDKILQPANKKEKPLPRPKFIHGKMGEVVNKIDSNKPFLLYISGDDSSSHHFETNILTQPVIIKIMVKSSPPILKTYIGRSFRMFGTDIHFE